MKKFTNDTLMNINESKYVRSVDDLIEMTYYYAFLCITQRKKNLTFNIFQ